MNERFFLFFCLLSIWLPVVMVTSPALTTLLPRPYLFNEWRCFRTGKSIPPSGEDIAYFYSVPKMFNDSESDRPVSDVISEFAAAVAAVLTENDVKLGSENIFY